MPGWCQRRAGLGHSWLISLPQTCRLGPPALTLSTGNRGAVLQASSTQPCWDPWAAHQPAMALPCTPCAAWERVAGSRGSGCSNDLGNISWVLQQCPAEEAWRGAALHPCEKMLISQILIWSKLALMDNFAK